ncbi:MAG: response regulator transcription factor [Anaerolineaceae bacterium]|nr:response regulator transcription factor [Anaerolineaceae bacterium]
MSKINRLVWIASGSLIGVGLLSLVLNFILGWSIDLGLPLVFMMLGAAFYLTVGALSQKWPWTELFYIPGSLMLALGLVFLLDVLTGDWKSWAYAWLLALAGAALGVLLANRGGRWPQVVNLVGLGSLAAAVTFFVLFGAIAGGRFMQVMAPILLVAGGLSLRFLRLEKLLPAWLLPRPATSAALQTSPALPTPDQSQLVERLSGRELEVLRLIDLGLSNPEIAEKLTLAPSTVKTHINNIYGKLGVQTRIQAIRQAREWGLLKP